MTAKSVTSDSVQDTPPPQAERRRQSRRASDFQFDRLPGIFSSFESFGRHTLLMDTQANVLYRSKMVDALLADDALPLRLEPKFTLLDVHKAKQFKAFLDGLTRPLHPLDALTDHRRTKSCFLLLERAGTSPLLLSCFPMQLAPGDENELKIMAILCDPSYYCEEQWRVFQDLFGLTVTELRLCLALADGLSLADYSKKYAVTGNTARSQLKKVFEKTSTKRQSDLIRLIFLLTRL